MKRNIPLFFKKTKWQFFYGETGHIMANYMAMENRTKEMRKVSGIKFKAFVYTVHNNYFTVYADGKDCERVAVYLLNKIINNKFWLDSIFKNIYVRARELTLFSRKLEHRDYSKLSNRQLFVLYKKFTTLFVKMRLYSSLPTNLEHFKPVFTEYLQMKLAEYISKDSDGFNNVFSIMTTPLKFSYLKNEERDLLELGLFFKKNNFDKKLKRFTNKYCWINYTFQGKLITEDDFKQQIIELVNKNIDFKGEIDKYKKDKSTLKKQQLEFVKKYKFNKEIQKLFYYSQEIVYLKFLRKGIFAESYFHCEFLLNAIAKKLNTDRQTVQGMFQREVKEALINNKLDLTKVKDRIKDGCVLVWDGQSFDLDKKMRITVLKNLKKDEKIESKEILGQVAVIGLVKGRVKIINNDSDLKKMKEGDVMVSRLTNPNLLSAMKKAAAIVTDAGGLTCHAAIIARELKKPCIVGTKIGTMVLKDGDLVEVNANLGVITIII